MRSKLEIILEKVLALQIDQQSVPNTVQPNYPKDHAICDCIYVVLANDKITDKIGGLADCVKKHLVGTVEDPWGYAKNLNCPMFNYMNKLGKCRAKCASKRGPNGENTPAFINCVSLCMSKKDFRWQDTIPYQSPF
jgi:hypothetical protein